VKAVDVIKNEGEKDEDDDESQSCGHSIDDFRLPIVDLVCQLAPQLL
jgi:hypothetical protein